MNEATPSQPRLPEQQAAPRRKGPPARGVVLFLLVLAGLAALNQWAATSGTPVQWIEDDLDAALALAAERKQRVFLYLYEPNEPTHQRNERQVFGQRWARDRLEHAVCCRVALTPGDLRRVVYKYQDTPLFLLLNAAGEEMARTEGAVDETQFLTYIGKPAEAFARQSR